MTIARPVFSQSVSCVSCRREIKVVALLSALVALGGCSTNVHVSPEPDPAESGGSAGASGAGGAGASVAQGSSAEGGEAGKAKFELEWDGVVHLPEHWPPKQIPVESRPSCQFLETKCQGESCCESLEVPAGTFEMGRGVVGAPDACPADTTCSGDELPAHSVTLTQAFWLDKYEVTVGRYRKFVAFVEENPAWLPADANWRAEWDLSGVRPEAVACNGTWTEEPGDSEDKPITCIDYPSAFAFCAWDGGRLPTEAEWEYAAAGGDEERLYPWGSDYQACGQSSDHDCGNKAEAVGSYPRGVARWGQMDLGGNAKEMLLDTFGPYSASSCVDPLNIQANQHFVVRGAAFSSPATDLRAAARRNTPGDETQAAVGVRCVFLP